MAIALALVASLCWGVIDFVGGALSRKTSPFAVGLAQMTAASACAIPVALIAGGDPTPSDYLWASASGASGGIATGFFLRGLAAGRMGVVAPISAVGTGLVPLAVGLATGDRPTAIALAGVAAAFPAIWLLSSDPEPATHAGSSGLADAAAAGLLYGMAFVFLGQIHDEAGLATQVVLQPAAAVGMIIAALMVSSPWLPRDRFAWRGAWLGPIAVGAMSFFQIALHHGYLSLVAVIGSLYPATTILLAVLILRERFGRAQGVGLLLAAAAVVLIAVG